MTINHHPNDDTLARYAAGTLGAGPALTVDAHVAGCSRCRETVAGFLSVAALATEAMPRTAMTPDALPHTLALIERDGPAGFVATDQHKGARRKRPRRWPSNIVLPAALRDRDIGSWIWLGRGVRVSKVAIPEDPKANVILLWVKAGIRLPEHGHTGSEYTHVIKGSYSDGIGRYFPGDLLEADADLNHQPVVDPDSDCLCVAAIEGNIRFRGLLGRILQPFLSE